MNSIRDDFCQCCSTWYAVGSVIASRRSLTAIAAALDQRFTLCDYCSPLLGQDV